MTIIVSSVAFVVIARKDEVFIGRYSLNEPFPECCNRGKQSRKLKETTSLLSRLSRRFQRLAMTTLLFS